MGTWFATDQAGDNGLKLRLRLHVTGQDMAESVQTLAARVDELQQLGDVDLWQSIEEGVVDALMIACVRQAPGGLSPLLAKLDVGILTCQDAPVHRVATMRRVSRYCTRAWNR